MKKYFASLAFQLVALFAFGQNVVLEGYVYESGNRGYLNVVKVSATDTKTNTLVGETFSNMEGFFTLEVPQNIEVDLKFFKEMFESKSQKISIGSNKAFVKVEMKRAPGYLFEITMAEKKDRTDVIKEAIKGARVEVYNNTTQEVVMDMIDYAYPEFNLNLENGNHYTILIRKNGFLSKRMEAYVNVEGCILCFEGLGTVRPGVSDNLTEGNENGVLLANVELERIFEGKKMEVQNLYYDLNKATLRRASRKELNKVVTMMNDNPNLTLELGSHTDSRGKNDFNLELSQRRAESAVQYLINNGGISKTRILSKGYGETLLVNECADGIKCSEEKHQENRRTELKIVGITNLADVRSLAEMKKAEQMDGIIEDLMNQEQIQAKDEDDLKEKLKEKDGGLGMQAPLTPEQDVEKKRRQKEELLARKKAYDELTKDKNNVALEMTAPSKTKLPEAVGEPSPTQRRIENGIAIVALIVKRPLSRKHPLKLEYRDRVAVYIAENGLLHYVIDGFYTKEKALEELTADFMTEYPEAKVVEFNSGRMIE